jgi:hypothetical protein
MISDFVNFGDDPYRYISHCLSDLQSSEIAAQFGWQQEASELHIHTIAALRSLEVFS